MAHIIGKGWMEMQKNHTMVEVYFFMMKLFIAYFCRLLILFLAVAAFFSWILVSKIKNLDSLETLSGTMGLSSDWKGRVEILEKRHPWSSEKDLSWADRELDAFLAVKAELMPALKGWRERHEWPVSDHRSEQRSSSESMMADILRLRAILLSALEKRHISLSAYCYFNELVLDFEQRGEKAVDERKLTATQRLAMHEREALLGNIDATGAEYLGLPH
jgi:hypothetical protein